jgi:hypothetical protein
MTRQELYDLVWSTPSSIAARQIGVSDVYLARICRSLAVPKPPLGYWQKRAVGRAPPPPALPAPQPGVPQIWSRGNVIAQPPALRIDHRTVVTRLAQPLRRKTALHELVRVATNHFNSAESGADGYLRPRKKLLLDITTSRDGLPRCLRFASDLFHNLETKGHRPLIAPAFDELIRVEIRRGDTQGGWDAADLPWSPLRPTVAYVFGVPIGLAVVETCETKKLRYIGDGRFVPQKEYSPDRYPGPSWPVEKQQPTGKIKLVCYSPFIGIHWLQEWIETPGSTLGSNIEKIITVLEGRAMTLVTELEIAGRYF